MKVVTMTPEEIHRKPPQERSSLIQLVRRKSYYFYTTLTVPSNRDKHLGSLFEEDLDKLKD